MTIAMQKLTPVLGDCVCGGKVYVEEVVFNGGLDNESTSTCEVCTHCDHCEPYIRDAWEREE